MKRAILTLALVVGGICAAATDAELDVWQRDADKVSRDVYVEYREDGNTRALAALENLERGFDKVLAEVKTCKVDDVPIVWHVYNMGCIVKTKEALFSIDLNHRRDLELVPLLDFALITHNHSDHYREPFYKAMDKAGKIVISNFKDNYGASRWHPGETWDCGGYTRDEKTFKIKDVEIRTSLVDHNPYLIDFTTAFEIRVGKWTMYHTGDCGIADKFKTKWGRPDLWVMFPGCGVDVVDAFRRVRPKKVAFGHLLELGHRNGRLCTPSVKASKKKIEELGGSVVIPRWGERVL